MSKKAKNVYEVNYVSLKTYKLINIHCLNIRKYNKNIKKCIGKTKSKFRKEEMGGEWNREEI